MTNFAFYLGDDEAVRDGLRRAAASTWGPVREASSDSFHLFIPSADYDGSFCESRGALGVISGYVRADDAECRPGEGEAFESAHNRRFISQAVEEEGWPLADGWTGSFSAVAYSKASRAVFLCNDVLGHAPVYFSTQGQGLLGGTSLIALSRCARREVDAVGVAQRLTPPYCNYGRRTLLKRVFRLLPGERLKCSGDGRGFSSMFDNTLCGGVTDGEVGAVARTVWDCLRRETVLAVGHRERVGVAMSGGWDSRLILGAVTDKGGGVECYTYGSEEHYETSVARRCAGAIGARHRCFPIEDKYFPPRSSLEQLVRETEAANYMEWYGLIEAVGGSGEGKGVLLLGDLCEGIDGRYIRELASRGARRKSFVNSLLGRPERIAASDEAAFTRWKGRMTREITENIARVARHLSPELADMCDENTLAREVAEDLELSFRRVEENMPAFAPMYDELFQWFHRIRFLLGAQIPFLSSTFHPVSPGMSLRFLRLISTVHPGLRIRRRLMDAIARLPEFDALASIPSSQIPWLSARSPSLLRELLWGGRSGLDQVLIRAVMRSRNVWRRQRVLRSLDYIREYRREYVVPTVQGWFSERWVKGDAYVGLAKARGNLSAWPLIGVDISAPANVSIILDLCETG
jgi:hypothetical protein